MNEIAKHWKHFEDENSYILIINGVQIASVQESDESGWDIYAYDSDWHALFATELGCSITTYTTNKEAMNMAETVFHKWLVNTCTEILYS